MKVAWFTPFNKKSAIGKYSKLAVEALSQSIEVDLFVYVEDEKDADSMEIHQTSVPVKFYDSLNVLGKLSEYDICIYNMGDNSEYHSMVYDVFLNHPGIIIAHDVSLHNFARGYYICHKNSPDEYVGLVQKKYGDNAKDIFNAAVSSEKWNQLDFLKYSFSEQLFEKALGLVVHSDYHKNHIAQFYRGPILVTPLLYRNEWKGIDPSLKFQGYNVDKINVLTVGNVNPNKHADDIIKAIGMDQLLKEKIEYTIIGSQVNREYIKKLQDMIKEYHLQDVVHLIGYVEEDELEYYYHYADIISNLRYPACEGGSASLVEQMQSGKGIIVTDTGVYSEIPDDCLFKANAKSSVHDITEILKMIIRNNEKLELTAANAKKYAAEHFCEEVYVRNVLGFLDEVTFTLPLYEVMQRCSDDITCMQNTSIKDTIAKEVEDLYCVLK